MSNQRGKWVTENKQSTIDIPTGCVVKIQANGIMARRHHLKMVAHNGRESENLLMQRRSSQQRRNE
ncbi:hypothetical protein N7532_007661 [Penicillium argentinense]|uniref:Uncharacterized protein n=1 Tax=Penicillium argentinense TaxID=1131581 RepID=A0A9W9EVU4_9EURO|nr:uncharacterized protein N7532_007661 [Penicillium argentinense]KAJ5088977.1 hypothetical protein N7532_007661 [Penicillium argentinense]